jgi:hypothetical protein
LCRRTFATRSSFNLSSRTPSISMFGHKPRTGTLPNQMGSGGFFYSSGPPMTRDNPPMESPQLWLRPFGTSPKLPPAVPGCYASSLRVIAAAAPADTHRKYLREEACSLVHRYCSSSSSKHEQKNRPRQHGWEQRNKD